ncbi:MAG: phosphocarrier protein HPr [Micromonosporaceae bacterium]|jgi:phosphotransferase system HPr (HPr) family protein|nr:phosphocarrier protein HPr [Micromonosporaceae bacterium]
MSESSDPTAQVEVLLPAHLHARPAGALVQVAARFSSTVEISYGEKTANARSVLAVLGLGAFAGSAVLVRARGDDASTAVREIAQILATVQ